MKKGYGQGDRYANDPIGSDAPRGKARSQRKHRNDGKTLTGTEQRVKNSLMRQFMRTGEGSGGRSEAYVNSPAWCAACGRHLNPCSKCNQPAPWVDF